MAEKILTSELVINASDQSGQVFEKVGAKLDKLASAGRRIGGMSSQFQTLGNHVNGAAQKLDLLHSKMSRIESAGKSLSKVLGPLSGTMSAIAAFEVAKLTGEAARETVKATAQGAHERVRMETAGMTPAEMKEAEGASARLTGEFKPVSQTTILHLLRNARSIVGTYEEAEKIIEPLLKTYVVAMGAHPQQREELEGDFDKLVKGMEIKGVTQDLPAFRRYLNGMSKALNVFGDTLRPTDYYEMFKYGRQATQNLSEQFMLMTAPTFAQEMGGSSAGKAFSTAYQEIVGGAMKQKAIVELEKFGLLDPSKVIRTKTGATKGVLPGGVVGSQLFGRDPYAWMQQVFLPHLASKGVTDPARIQEIIALAFQSGTAAQFMTVLATQQSRIEKDWKLVEHAEGSEAAGKFMAKDPYVAMAGVTEQFGNLLQAAGGPLAQPAADALNATAAALNHLYEAAGKSPWMAAGGLLGAAGTVIAGTAAAGYWGAKRAARFIRGGVGAVAEEMPAEIAALKGALRGPAFNWLLPMTQLASQHDLLDTPAGGGTWDQALRRYNRGAGEGPELKGSADVNVTVKVDAGDLDAKIDARVDNRIGGVRINGVPSSGTTGSLGKSMQEAGPGPY